MEEIQSDTNDRFPRVGGTLLLMLIGWTVTLGTAALFTPFLGMKATTFLGNTAGIGAAVWAGCRLSHLPKASALGLRLFPLKLIPTIALLAVTGSVLGAEIAVWIHRIVPLPDVYQELFADLLFADSWAEFLSRAVLLGVMAPVTEELLFRGVIQQGLVANYGAKNGIMAAAISFGTFHLIPWQVVGVTLVGVLLGIVFHRTGSVFAGMWLHAVWNLLPLVLVSAVRVLIPETDLASLGLDAGPPKGLGASVLVPSSLLFALGMRRFLRQTETDPAAGSGWAGV